MADFPQQVWLCRECRTWCDEPCPEAHPDDNTQVRYVRADKAGLTSHAQMEADCRVVETFPVLAASLRDDMVAAIRQAWADTEKETDEIPESLEHCEHCLQHYHAGARWDQLLCTCGEEFDLAAALAYYRIAGPATYGDQLFARYLIGRGFRKAGRKDND